MITFATLLSNARRLKWLGWNRLSRKAYLLGMMRAHYLMLEREGYKLPLKTAVREDAN